MANLALRKQLRSKEHGKKCAGFYVKYSVREKEISALIKKVNADKILMEMISQTNLYIHIARHKRELFKPYLGHLIWVDLKTQISDPSELEEICEKYCELYNQKVEPMPNLAQVLAIHESLKPTVFYYKIVTQVTQSIYQADV